MKAYLVVKVDNNGNMINNVIAYDSWNDACIMCDHLNIIAHKRKHNHLFIIQTFTL